MKKLLVLSAAAFCFISAGKAQSSDMSVNNDVVTQKQNEASIRKERKEQQSEKRKLEDGEISDRTIQEFFADFGNLPIVETDRIPGFDKITFLKDGAAQTAYYDASFDLVGTIAASAFEDLPKDAQDYIGKHYNDYTVKAVQLFDDNEANDNNIYLYDQQFVDEDSYFVELEKDNKTVILHVTLNGTVYFFSALK
ncbi:MAG TPA: hypothetical protein VKI61_16655 [Chitinophagaceae bacterium]|nr:hypothetical protein [Chitinophagaceae bacterium]